jgi:hypothetical protein
MNRKTALHWCAPVLLVASGALVSAQVQLPSAPPKQFGGSISPAYEGWFDNPDGTHSFLIGYYSRNTDAEIDVPIGPNNHFEPGDPDRGQPTHFITRRRFGVFTVTVPKEFPKTQKISWTLTVNGVTTTIPFYMHKDYNVTPLKGSEESPDGTYDLPPVLRFEENGPSFTGPLGTIAKAVSRTATVGTPMPLQIWADDDARFSGGGEGPQGAVVTANVAKYRGPGPVTVTSASPSTGRGAGRGGGRAVAAGPGSVTFETLQGGKPMEPYKGKASAEVKFSQPGDYVLQVTGNDYSGNGGGGSGCCWTTAMLKVAVKAAEASGRQ